MIRNRVAGPTVPALKIFDPNADRPSESTMVDRLLRARDAWLDREAGPRGSIRLARSEGPWGRFRRVVVIDLAWEIAGPCPSGTERVR